MARPNNILLTLYSSVISLLVLIVGYLANTQLTDIKTAIDQSIIDDRRQFILLENHDVRIAELERDGLKPVNISDNYICRQDNDNP